MAGFFGRREILTSYEEITKANLVKVLKSTVAVHEENSAEIDYLLKYMRGQQPILDRKKEVRPEICNKVVENHASEIVQFTSGYFLGEPVTYVCRGDKDGSPDEVNELNTLMFFEDKASHDKELATWMAICGQGYRMVLPDKSANLSPDEAPFELDTPDPRYTFVVYNSGFGHRRVMAVRQIHKNLEDNQTEVTLCGYTKDHYFEVKDDKILKWKPHILRDIPIYEYRLNMNRMGSFEPALPLLDALNAIASNRVDSVEQFVQAFWKFVGCKMNMEQFEEFKKKGAILVPPNDNGGNIDVDLIVKELNQEQMQTFVDYIYDQVLTICGMPTTTKGGSSTSDTGAAVFLRDGWSQCEARAKDTELLFKRSEKQFLRTVINIIRSTKEFNITLAEIECKFTRRQHDNLISKSQALKEMLEAGIEPSVAIATCGLFNDPMDVAKQSQPYLEKWKPQMAYSDNGGSDPLDISARESTPNHANSREADKRKNAGNPATKQEE